MLKKSQGIHPNSFTDWPFDVWLNLKEMYGISKSFVDEFDKFMSNKSIFQSSKINRLVDINCRILFVDWRARA